MGDIIVQLDIFDEQRECDEAQSLRGPHGINLNSHLDVFYAILRQVQSVLRVRTHKIIIVQKIENVTLAT